MDYKNTLNLPRTDFAMKADLVTREPQRLEKWERENLYAKIQDTRQGAPKFVLHDGPPFANGDVHIGTALNKILKDIIVKYKTLRGFSAPYIPGWDCHGLPIEFKVTQEMRKGSAGTSPATADASSAFDPANIRKACEAYARKFIDIQRAQFKRLGVLGDWENPYLTLNKEYEADELRLFADIVEKGFVYRGKKPVYWSIPCRTALAEAEVEYQDHISQSIYVKFPVVGQPNTNVIIWTTTPWTLPANLAVAFNKDFTYSVVKVGDEKNIVFNGLLAMVAEKCAWQNYEVVSELRGDDLVQLEYQHPFCHRRGKLHAAPFVESSTGTGFVHIAPGHGLEDYGLGRQVGLPIYSPVDDEGRLAHTNELPVEQQMPAELVGKSILEKNHKSEANEGVLAILREKNALAHQENYTHSYPHCWRSKTPVIFRAMDQWFIKVDHELGSASVSRAEFGVAPDSSTTQTSSDKKLEELSFRRDTENSTPETCAPLPFRQLALQSIDEVKWIPEWGVNRIKGAVESRPDWCISRQRTWGVPIPAFYDAKGNAILDAQIVRNTADLIEKHGSNVWFEKSVAELWSNVKPSSWTGAEPVAKSQDTLDVWIDSGSSSRAVIARRPEIRGQDKPFQCDVYLEGSDQHRGWFQSSLLLSLAGNGAPPFKTVLTHGFMVDADREKISKSKQGQGGYEKPQTAEAYVKKYGADVVRLWVASQDYRSDIVVSEERINKVSETYRGIRNCLRYQLSNLYDFDPAKHAAEKEKLTGLDRWILSQFSDLEKQVIEAYDAYEFHVVYQKISQFIAVELSAIYHDVVKDRLYTDPANSPRRRSTQTALYILVKGLCQMLSPMLAFTADEAWELVPARQDESVHATSFRPTNLLLSDEEKQTWADLFQVRNSVLQQLEKSRQAKTIGKSLDARVTVSSGKTKSFERVSKSRNDLKELLNVSQFESVAEVRNDQDDVGITHVNVAHADGQKCERCWHWETDVGSHTEHPALCGRCVEAVKQATASLGTSFRPA